MLEFNADGIIKLSDAIVKQNEIEERSVVITREQISVKPAIAQARIRLPEHAQNVDEMISFYYKIAVSQFKVVEHSVQKVDDRTFLIKVEKGSMMMYSLLNFMIDCFKSKLSGIGQNQKVILKSILP